MKNPFTHLHYQVFCFGYPFDIYIPIPSLESTLTVTDLPRYNAKYEKPSPSGILGDVGRGAEKLLSPVIQHPISNTSLQTAVTEMVYCVPASPQRYLNDPCHRGLESSVCLPHVRSVKCRQTLDRAENGSPTLPFFKRPLDFETGEF